MVPLMDCKWMMMLILCAFIVGPRLTESIEFAMNKCELDPAIRKFIYISQYNANIYVRLRWSKDFENFESGHSVSFTLYSNLANELRFTFTRPPPQCVKRLGTKFPYIYDFSADITYGERNCRMPLLFTDDWHFADFMDAGKDDIPPKERLKYGMGFVSDAKVFITQQRKYFSFFRPNLIANDSSAHWQVGQRDFEQRCEPVTETISPFHKMKVTVSRFHGSNGEPLKNLPPNCRIELEFSGEHYLLAKHIQPPPPTTSTQAPTTTSTTAVTCPTIAPCPTQTLRSTVAAEPPTAAVAQTTSDSKSASKKKRRKDYKPGTSAIVTPTIPPSAMPLATAKRNYTTFELAIFTIIVAAGVTLALVLYAWFAYIAVRYFKAKDRELLHPDELFGGELDDDDLENVAEVVQIVDSSPKVRKDASKKSAKSPKQPSTQQTKKTANG